MSNENFPFSTHKVIKIAGHSLRALRLTFVGELGWELHIPKDTCVPVYEAIIQHGKNHGITDAGDLINSCLSVMILSFCNPVESK